MKFQFRHIVMSGIFLASIEGNISPSHAATKIIDNTYSQVQTKVSEFSQIPWNSVQLHTNTTVHSVSSGQIIHKVTNFFHGIVHTITNVIHKVSQTITNGVHLASSVIKTVPKIIYYAGKLVPPGLAGGHFILNGVKLVFGNLFPPAALTPSAQVLADSAGKTPVVLVQGSFGNSTSLQKYYDALEAAGIPTYAPTLGKGASLVGDIIPMINGTAPVETSTLELSQFIDQVQAQTGSPKVDLVAYSQGGLIAKNYIAHDDKNNVKAVVTLGGTDHGAGLNGLTDYFYSLPKAVQNILLKIVTPIIGPAQPDQFPNSPILQELNNYPDTKAGINYLQIASRDDTVASPYKTSFLKPVPGAHVTNIEVHSIPGVTGNFDHLEYPFSPEVVKTAVDYIKSQGESAPAVIQDTKTSPKVTAPAVSLL